MTVRDDDQFGKVLWKGDVKDGDVVHLDCPYVNRVASVEVARDVSVTVVYE